MSGAGASDAEIGRASDVGEESVGERRTCERLSRRGGFLHEEGRGGASDAGGLFLDGEGRKANNDGNSGV